MIVADVNILIYHEVEGPFTAMTKLLRKKDPEWFTSTLWSFEFVNVLTTMMRAKVVKIDRALEVFSAAEAAYADSAIAFSHNTVLNASERYAITGYDAQYIALAEWMGVPCVTADAPLVKKVPHIAVLLSDFVNR
jgi:predicted nucleic acid-binding protein